METKMETCEPFILLQITSHIIISLAHYPHLCCLKETQFCLENEKKLTVAIFELAPISSFSHPELCSNNCRWEIAKQCNCWLPHLATAAATIKIFLLSFFLPFSLTPFIPIFQGFKVLFKLTTMMLWFGTPINKLKAYIAYS